MTSIAIEAAVKRQIEKLPDAGTDIRKCAMVYYKVKVEDKKPFKKRMVIELQIRIETCEPE